MMDGYDSTSDGALIEAAQQGDRDAAARLYHRHVDRVHRICYRIVLDGSQVTDCVQEVWLKVFRNLDQFECEKSFAGWLNRVAANTAIDYYRKWRKQGRYIGIEEVPSESLTTGESQDAQSLDDAAAQERVRQALQEITVNQRTAFVLRYYEDMSPAQIAHVLGCRVGTVRTHVRRGLLALRAKLAVKPIAKGAER